MAWPPESLPPLCGRLCRGHSQHLRCKCLQGKMSYKIFFKPVKSGQDCTCKRHKDYEDNRDNAPLGPSTAEPWVKTGFCKRSREKSDWMREGSKAASGKQTFFGNEQFQSLEAAWAVQEAKQVCKLLILQNLSTVNALLNSLYWKVVTERKEIDVKRIATSKRRSWSCSRGTGIVQSFEDPTSIWNISETF